MRSIIQNNLWIPLCFFALFCVTVLFRPLLPIDETRYLSVAWEMFLRQDWLAPLTVNGQPYHHKPPLLFWMINAVWAVTGPSRWSATIVPVVMGALSVLLTMLVARRLFPDGAKRVDRVPFIMMGCLPFLVYGSMIMFDVTMTVWVLLTLLALIAYAKTGKWVYVLLMALVMGAGVLTKGPVAYLYVVFPMLLGPLWAEVAGSKFKWYAGCLGAMILSIVPVLFWLVPVLNQSDHHFAFWLVWEQTAGRVMGHFGDAHVRPFYFYIPVAAILMIPWIFFPQFWHEIRGIGVKARSDAGVRFVLCWIVPVFIAFSIIRGKQPHYLVPLIPGMVILIAVFLQNVSNLIIERVFTVVFFILLSAHAVGAQTFLKSYDLAPVATYVRNHPDQDWAYANKYHGELTFLARIQKPIDVIQREDIDAWFKDHPSGYAIIRFNDPNNLQQLTLLADIPYRGKRMGVFKKEAIRRHAPD